MYPRWVTQGWPCFTSVFGTSDAPIYHCHDSFLLHTFSGQVPTWWCGQKEMSGRNSGAGAAFLFSHSLGTCPDLVHSHLLTTTVLDSKVPRPQNSVKWAFLLQLMKMFDAPLKIIVSCFGKKGKIHLCLNAQHGVHIHTHICTLRKNKNPNRWCDAYRYCMCCYPLKCHRKYLYKFHSFFFLI